MIRSLFHWMLLYNISAPTLEHSHEKASELFLGHRNDSWEQKTHDGHGNGINITVKQPRGDKMKKNNNITNYSDGN